MRRFKKWQRPRFEKNGLTKWMWMCQNKEGLVLSRDTDIGAFTYINAKYGVVIEENVQIGSHCSIYSESTIDNKVGKIKICKNARIGSHTTIMPGVTIGKNSLIGAHSFVNSDIAEGTIAFGVPAKIHKKLK